ncbi:MAG: peptidase [Gemmatimonadetes bacterium]|nr:peptidase [Gemmatimonadota bacterium]
MLLVDAHLDLAMNALNWDRNLDLTVEQIREMEAGMIPQKGRACGTVAFPEMRKGEVGLSIVTVIARTSWPDSPATGAACQEISYAKAQGQLAYYRCLESQGKVRMIGTKSELEDHLGNWQADPDTTPLGMVLSMEGADPIVWPGQMQSWWKDGLRIVGLSHYGFSAYAHGTDTEGGLRGEARALLKEMEQFGAVLDTTHLADLAFFEATDAFDGRIMASHQNSRTLVDGVRQFTDEQLKRVIERDGVIGAALDAWMLYPGWIKGETQPEVVGLDAVADQIDYVCQLAGNCKHAAIGSDLDGGYGNEQCPRDLDTIVDLQKVAGLLADRGYADEDVRAIMHGNWIHFLREVLPD